MAVTAVCLARMWSAYLKCSGWTGRATVGGGPLHLNNWRNARVGYTTLYTSALLPGTHTMQAQ